MAMAELERFSVALMVSRQAGQGVPELAFPSMSTSIPRAGYSPADQATTAVYLYIASLIANVLTCHLSRGRLSVVASGAGMDDCGCDANPRWRPRPRPP